MKLPKFFNYCQGSSANYGINSLCFEDGQGNLFYYSYETLIAFESKGELRIIKNYWNITTGKHLNSIDRDHSIRLNEDEFKNEYNKTFKEVV
jgi:hypothetical protein